MLGHTRPLVLALTIAALFFDSVWAHGPVHARLKEIDRRLAESPNDPALFVQRAALHREHRDLERARADLDRALGLNTDYPSARIARASLALALGEHDDAIRLSRAILATDLDHPIANVVLARALTSKAEFALAVDAYDRAIDSITRPSPDLFLERCRAAVRAFPEHPFLAIWGLEEGIERLGCVVSLALPLIELEIAAGDFDIALERVSRLEQQSDQTAHWRVLRAEILLTAGDLEPAIEVAREARTALARSRRRSTRREQLPTRASAVIETARRRIEELR